MSDVENASDEDTPTHLIFSLSVNSETPISAFAGVPGRKRAVRDDDDNFYSFGTVSFSEDDGKRRADKLDDAVNSALDRLDATGVDPAELARGDVLVRAFFTFDPGAETISAATVARLARIHATIWVDANAG